MTNMAVSAILMDCSTEELTKELASRGAYTLEYLVKINLSRCETWHKGDDPWTAERWITAIVGELGEMANERKKIFRAEDGSVGILDGSTLVELRWKEAKEWADTILYLILYCAYVLDVNHSEIIREVFNAKSEQLGFEERL